MADVWLAELTFGPVTYTGPTSGLTAVSASYVFAAIDFEAASGAGVYPAIQMLLTLDNSGSVQTVEQHGLLTSARDILVNPGAQWTSAGTAAFTGGGHCTITKDEGAGTYAYSGPGHTSTYSPSGGTVAGELGPDQIQAYCSASNTGAFSFASALLQVQFHDLWGRQNGVKIKGSDLSNTDRGGWVPQSDALTPWIFSRSGNVTTTETDDATTEGVKIEADTPSGGGAGDAAGFREWDGTTYLPGQDPGALSLASTRIPQHGAVLVAYVDPAAKTDLRGRDTYDQARTWADGLIYSAAGAKNNSPNILWDGRRLYAIWHDGAVIRQSYSQDLATTWSAPVTLSITGTNPKVLVDPRHGLQYYFYIDASKNLQLMRSADFGNTFIDAAPHLVAAAITLQTVAAEFAPDGSLIVGFIAAGAWAQLRSKDLGLTWS